MGKEILMKMAAEEAYKGLQEAMEEITSAEYFPEQASREAINNKLRIAGDALVKVNNWLYAIKEA